MIISYENMKNNALKRPRSCSEVEQEEPPQPLVDALDAIINPIQCMAEYNSAVVAEMLAVKSNALEVDEELKNLLKSYKGMKSNDQTANAAFVSRSSADKRYLLSLICVNIGRLEEIKRGGMSDAIDLYNEALFWHPDSVEGALCLGLAWRHVCISQVQLDRVEGLWQRAYDASRAYSFFSTSSMKSIGSVVPYSSYNRMIQNRERNMMKELTDKLILHYCQEDKMSLAIPIMNAFHYRYKLSQTILCYPRATNTSDAKSEGMEGQQTMVVGEDAKCAFACGVDKAVPEVILLKLQHVFRPEAPFWSEHSYDFFLNASRGVGYFSYLYPFRELSPGNVVEQAILFIYNTVSRKFPDVAKKANIGIP